MSTLKVNTIGNKGSAVDFPNKLTVRGNAIEQGYTASGTEPSSPSEGDIWWDSTNEVVYQYVNGEFKSISIAPPFTWGGDRGLHAHGYNYTSNYMNSIDYFDITSSGNASDFGDLTVSRSPCACGNSSRGLFGAGNSPRVNTIDYVTTSTTGNAVDFGDLSQTKNALASASNGTRALWFGGYVSDYANNVIEYVTIATTGNSTDFGDTTAGSTNGAGISNETYGLVAGGFGVVSGSGTNKQTIDKVTIATAGNATDYGDLTAAKDCLQGASDATRGLIGGGYSSGSKIDVIEYVTVATDGNGTDFGDLTAIRKGSATSNSTYAVFVAGEDASGLTNVLEIVTIQTTGNATDHGDLTANSGSSGSWSGNAA